nr:hypothetical protein [Tanacetum cinerariifolium]
MATTIEQQVELDEALVPSTQRIPGQSFDELPFEEEILEFFRFLGHSAQIRILTDGRREKSLSSRKSHDTGASYVMVMEHMTWQTDYCIMKKGMSILRGRKSVPGMNSSERELER